ncbi:hypothetical protein HYE68_003892 [Fusarium pseudograminearum]|nr:hypothetical protein HYE68_003892 [Fusarium pseudograminearum]
MKFSAATLLAAAASVSAATAVFEVKDFTASCIAHSTFCDYKFKVIQPNSMETWEHAVVCNARAQSTDYTLPDIKDGKCKDSSRTFTVTRSDKGLLVKISQPVSPKSNTVGEHFIPKSLLFQSEVPNAEVQMYNGPKDFEFTQTS